MVLRLSTIGLSPRRTIMIAELRSYCVMFFDFDHDFDCDLIVVHVPIGNKLALYRRAQGIDPGLNPA
ncbi:hypothetical protein SAMN06295888_103105 [Desulfonatronum zhilinae]|nr:hypothetical protein SAMN06295888_103105 [Desulfonatronum zhilinae]